MQGNAREANGSTCPEVLQVVDVEVLLDLLSNPALVEKTGVVIEKAILRGLLNEVTVGSILLTASNPIVYSYLKPGGQNNQQDDSCPSQTHQSPSTVRGCQVLHLVEHSS